MKIIKPKDDERTTFFADVPIGQVFTVTAEGNDVYIKVSKSFKANDGGLFNVLTLFDSARSTDGRLQFSDHDLVYQRPNAELHIGEVGK
jgi:hypothetical protein